LNDAKNDVVRSILMRRAVRDFKGRQIKKECAYNAPSAMNAQNWPFPDIRDSSTIEKLP
jgi:hypothetical protein